ncbi:alpha/beta fold hydrolase [Nocardia sp. NPDC058666]|uniref:alpha/beta fold hydrolase n=1 Tax=Nocardia sp. NPDC058666 TaxID=3346587 RepID=UPI003646A65C
MSTAPATVVYVPGPLSDSSHFSPLIAQLDEHFAGGIAQLIYDQRGHRSDLGGVSNVGMAQLVDDLQVVLDRASGSVVLVVHSLAAILAQEWLYRHRYEQPRVGAIVAVGPVAELPDTAGVLTTRPMESAYDAGAQLIRQLTTALGSRDRINDQRATDCARQVLRAYRRCGADLAVVEDMLRAIPTWIVAGARDPVVGCERIEELAATIWAELIIVDDADHGLLFTHPVAVADAVVAALEAVHDRGVFGGGW